MASVGKKGLLSFENRIFLYLGVFNLVTVLVIVIGISYIGKMASLEVALGVKNTVNYFWLQSSWRFKTFILSNDSCFLAIIILFSMKLVWSQKGKKISNKCNKIIRYLFVVQLKDEFWFSNNVPQFQSCVQFI